MNIQMLFYLTVLAIIACVANIVLCAELDRTDIKIVNDNTRYTTLNSNVTLRPFKKVHHVKGNIIFSSGERILGDHFITSVMDQTSYSRPTDVEVSMWYPAKGREGLILSFIQILTDLSTLDADVYFVNGGGIGETFAEMLLVANKTEKFGYQIFMYGY